MSLCYFWLLNNDFPSFYHQIESTYHDLYQYGLILGRYGTIRFDPRPHLSALQYELHNAQCSLGWRQLYYGRLSPQWISQHNQSHPDINGLHYFTKYVTFIWKAVLRQWQLRNQHLYPTNTLQEDRTHLQAIVNQILHDAQQDPNLNDLVATVTLETIMAKPIRKLRQWINNSHNHIRAHYKAAQLRAKLHTKDIQQYFTKKQKPHQINSMAKNLLRPP